MASKRLTIHTIVPSTIVLRENPGFVVGRLYSLQYKSIFGALDKVRLGTCEEARPSRLDFQREKVKIHHVIASMQDC